MLGEMDYPYKEEVEQVRIARQHLAEVRESVLDGWFEDVLLPILPELEWEWVRDSELLQPYADRKLLGIRARVPAKTSVFMVVPTCYFKEWSYSRGQVTFTSPLEKAHIYISGYNSYHTMYVTIRFEPEVFEDVWQIIGHAKIDNEWAGAEWAEVKKQVDDMILYYKKLYMVRLLAGAKDEE